LHPAQPTERSPKLPVPISDKIIELKQQNPTFGIKRISQLLRRWVFLPASPETVRQHLHAADLMPETTRPKSVAPATVLRSRDYWTRKRKKATEALLV
jgi:hypothetical protein